MPDVSVASDKIEYLFKCLEKYNGSTGFLVLFFVMLIFVAVYADDRVKRIFVPLSVVMVLTVYNPLFPLLLTKPLAFVVLIHLEGLIVKELFAESFLNSRDFASLKFSLNSSSQSE